MSWVIKGAKKKSAKPFSPIWNLNEGPLAVGDNVRVLPWEGSEGGITYEGDVIEGAGGPYGVIEEIGKDDGVAACRVRFTRDYWWIYPKYLERVW